VSQCRAPLSPNQMCERVWTLSGRLRPGLVLPQYPDDLFFREPARLHVHPSQVMDSTHFWRRLRGSGHPRSRHSVSLATETFVCRATKSSGSPRNSGATIPNAERKNASGHSRRRPKGRLRQFWESAPAPLRAPAFHHSSCVTLRLRFNYLSRVSQLSVPHPKAEVGADHRIRVSSLPALTSILVTAGSFVSGPSHVPITLQQHAFQMLNTLRPGEPGHVIGFWMTVFGTEGQPILEGIGKIVGLFAGKVTRVAAGHFAECRDISRKDR
jgi:hypothetical protein